MILADGVVDWLKLFSVSLYYITIRTNNNIVLKHFEPGYLMELRASVLFVDGAPIDLYTFW